MNQNRRDFIKAAAAGAAGVALGGCTGPKVGANERLLPPRMMWCYMAQLGMKMWERRIHYTDLKVDDSIWAKAWCSPAIRSWPYTGRGSRSG